MSQKIEFGKICVTPKCATFEIEYKGNTLEIIWDELENVEKAIRLMKRSRDFDEADSNNE